MNLYDVLSTLVPTSNLSADHIVALCENSLLRTVVPGNTAFKEGDTDNYMYYLLEGGLELNSTNNTCFKVVAGTDNARYPLAQFQPRQFTATAVEKSILLLLDREMLDSFLIGDTNTQDNDGVEVSDIDYDQSGDWMSRILQSPLYANISVENIQSIFSRVESIDVKKGDVIIRQGDEGDYYYIIQTGSCRISRKPHPDSQDVHLAYLREGDAFGEEAIIANLKRNASVTMISDGCLMRLGKQDFKQLILHPIQNKIGLTEARQLIDDGAIWLDVRYPDEYKDFSLENSLNIPLNMLRLQAENIDTSKQYITCCDTGARSAIASYILAQYDVQVFNLDVGLNQIKHQSATGMAETLTKKQITPPSSSQSKQTLVAEINQLRKELDTLKQQFREVVQIRDMAMQLEKTVMSATEKKLKSQREKINQQTLSANKLIMKARDFHKDLEQERKLVFQEVENYRKQQELEITKIREDVGKRLLEEEKKMQAFYAWKTNEVERIKQIKAALEKEYLQQYSLQNPPLENSIEPDVNNQEPQPELKRWLADQVQHELSPINLEIQKAKRKLIEDAKRNARNKNQSADLQKKVSVNSADTDKDKLV